MAFIHVYGIEVTEIPGTDLHQRMDATKQSQLLDIMLRLKVCIGNPDSKFKTVNIKNTSGYIHHITMSQQTLRHCNCAMLIENGDRCLPCQGFRASLKGITSHQATRDMDLSVMPSSHTALKVLNQEQLTERCKNLKSDNVVKSNELKRLKTRLERLDGTDITVEPEVHNIISSNVTSIKQDNLSPLLKLFLQQQVSASSKDKRGMRWHPLMIRWALGLKQKSSAAYRYLGSSGFIALPSEMTLSDYMHYRPAAVGIDVEGITELSSTLPGGADVAILAD